mmetsp:Transcript_41259/g.92934  ORF Transcript_41259/g.92934 Transcript_41259/m.92934 type:complete len:200 (-) Transcript_41259:1108-1707(-)
MRGRQLLQSHHHRPRHRMGQAGDGSVASGERLEDDQVQVQGRPRRRAKPRAALPHQPRHESGRAVGRAGRREGGAPDGARCFPRLPKRRGAGADHSLPREPSAGSQGPGHGAIRPGLAGLAGGHAVRPRHDGRGQVQRATYPGGRQRKRLQTRGRRRSQRGSFWRRGGRQELRRRKEEARGQGWVSSVQAGKESPRDIR